MAENIKRDSFVFYMDWAKAIKDLPSEVRLEIYDSIIDYVESGKLPNLKPIANVAMRFIKGDLERDFKKYENVKEKRAEAGRVGGIKSSKIKQSQANQANATFDKQIKQSQANQADNDNVNDNDTTNVVEEKEKKENSPPPYFQEFSKSGFQPLPLKSLYEKFKNDDGLGYHLKSNGINGLLENHLRSFCEWLRDVKGETEKSEKDFKTHFTAWARKRSQSEAVAVKPTQQADSPPPKKVDYAKYGLP